MSRGIHHIIMKKKDNLSTPAPKEKAVSVICADMESAFLNGQLSLALTLCFTHALSSVLKRAVFSLSAVYLWAWAGQK